MTGTSTASIIISGSNGPGTTFYANVEQYNGTSWTEIADVNQARNIAASAGSTTLAIMFGGNTPPASVSALTESWNGTSWTEVSDLGTARSKLNGQGTSSAAIASGGEVPPYSAATEEFTAADFTINPVTTS